MAYSMDICGALESDFLSPSAVRTDKIAILWSQSSAPRASTWIRGGPRIFRQAIAGAVSDSATLPSEAYPQP